MVALVRLLARQVAAETLVAGDSQAIAVVSPADDAPHVSTTQEEQ